MTLYAFENLNCDFLYKCFLHLPPFSPARVNFKFHFIEFCKKEVLTLFTAFAVGFSYFNFQLFKFSAI